LKAFLERQYQGFLNTPQLFSDFKVLGVETFQTKEKVDISAIENYAEELSKHKFLGKRAELFFLAYLNSSKRYSDVIHSFQINNEEKTVGELDIVCFDQFKQQWIHIELVYKLYIFTGEDRYDDFTQWIGPNLKDRLDYKVEKLKSHQLPLGHHRSIFKKIGASKIESFCCFKAKLFLHHKIKNIETSILNSNCRSGIYLNFEEFKTLKYQKSLFCVPEKVNWICKPEDNTYWYDFKKAEENLKLNLKEKRARLVWEKNENAEILEYFVVWW
jgi:hypothetical protein